MTCPQFKAHEVFNRIEMDKSTSYIIVEGHEPDVYDNALRGLMGAKGKRGVDWVVESGSDKQTILDFKKNSKANNFYIILDRDFDIPSEQLDRVVYLDRYSIENYLFDEMVIRQATSRLFKRGVDSLNLDSDKLINYYKDKLKELLGYLISYQLSDQKKLISWSDEKIIKKDCWNVCEVTVDELINRIKNDHPGIEPAINYIGDDFIKIFPGKLITSGVYHYLKKNIKPPKFTSVFNNENIFINALFSSAESSEDFIKCLEGPRSFLSKKSSTEQ